MKLRKIANISTSTVKRKVTFTDSMQSTLSYAQAPEDHYAVCFVDLLIRDIVEEMVIS